MRRYVLAAIALLAALPAFAEIRFNQSDTPDWVVSVEVPTKWSTQSQTPELVGQSIHYKLVNQQTYVEDKGVYHQFHQYVERPLTQDGLQSSGVVEIYFKPDYQQVTLHRLAVIRNGSTSDRLKVARISVLDVEPESANSLYGGNAKVLMIVPDFRLGDTIDYQFTVTGRNPVLGEKVSPSYSLGWSVPVERVFNRFTLPENRQIQYRTEVLDIQPKINVSDFGRSHSVQLEQTPAYDEDPEAPGHSNIYPFIEYSEFQSWSEVMAWAKPLFAYELPSENDTWQQWLQQIEQQPTDQKKVTLALQLVQNNIRYVGIEMGENSHRPHPPSETLTLAYGDCKDKTLLLIALLKAAGIEAEPFLVNTESTAALQRWLPTASAFNHVITRVQLKEKYYYIDPTLSYQSGDQISELGYYSYAVGLPVYSDEGLIPMPSKNQERASIAVVQEFQGYDFSLPVLLTSKATYYNEEADYQRYRFANTSLVELERKYIDYYTREYGATTIAKGLSFNDNSAENVFSVNIQMWVENFYQYDSEEKQFEYDIYAYLPDEYLTLPDRIARKQPYQVSLPIYLTHDIHIRHPTIYDSTTIKPDYVEIKNDIFTFKVSMTELLDQSRYHFSYRNHQETVAPENMNKYAEAIREARQHLSYEGWFNNVVAPEKTTKAREFFSEFVGSLPSKGDAL